MERQARIDREARARVAAENRRLDAARRWQDAQRSRRLEARDVRAVRLAEMADDGSCCGAPAVPVASAKFGRRHRTGIVPSRLPCPRALACENLYEKRRRDFPDDFTPGRKRERQRERVLEAIRREANPGDAECCGAPRVATASTKYVMRHREGFTWGDVREPCVWALRCQAKYSRRYRAAVKEDDPARYERERQKALVRNRRRPRTGNPTGRPPEPVIHGTPSGYLKERRRDGLEVCDQCREAWRNHQREYKKRRATV